MEDHGCTLFDTAVGRCGVAWGPGGIQAVQLPERHDRATKARLARSCPEARPAPPPDGVRAAIEAMRALLEGEHRDLSGIAVDLGDVPEFHRRVYEVARAIPPGETLTYGEVAARLGEPGAARAVGQALGRNPVPIIVPCHRVVAASGGLGGFSAPGGAATKRRMLVIEGAAAVQPSLFDVER